MQNAGFPQAQPAQTNLGMGMQPARFGTNLAQYMPQAGQMGQPAQQMPYSGGMNFVGFQPGSYWNAYPDARWENTGLTPQQHYLGWGLSEGRTGQSGMPGQVAGFPFTQANYGLGFGAPQATPQQPLSAGVAGIGGQMNLGMGSGAGAAQSGQQAAQQRPPQQGPIQQPALQQMQPTNRFGAMGLQAYQQQLGGQPGGLLAQPQQAQGAAKLDRYDQRYLDMMRQTLAGKDMSGIPAGRQQEIVQALQSGQVPEGLKKSPMYQRMVTDARAADQQRTATNAAQPWFLQQMQGGQLEQLPPAQRRQYLDQRNQAQQQYYMQNPGEIPKGMFNQAGGQGDFWKAVAGDYSPFMAQGAEYANTQQALWDKYQSALQQQGNVAANPQFQQFKRTWDAMGPAKLNAAKLTPEQAFAAMKALGTGVNGIASNSNLDVLLNGPMSQQDAAKYYGQQFINQRSLARR